MSALDGLGGLGLVNIISPKISQLRLPVLVGAASVSCLETSQFVLSWGVTVLWVCLRPREVLWGQFVSARRTVQVVQT